MKEIWKDIPGYENLYQASSLGRIKSLRKNIIMSQIDNGNGYLYVTLINNGKRKNHYVHRLIAKTFIKNFDEKKVTNHKDYNRKNNCIDNLENITQTENVRYSVKNRPKYLIAKTNTGEHHISKRGSIYRVTVAKKEHGGCRTIEDAIKLRDILLQKLINGS